MSGARWSVNWGELWWVILIIGFAAPSMARDCALDHQKRDCIAARGDWRDGGCHFGVAK